MISITKYIMEIGLSLLHKGGNKIGGRLPPPLGQSVGTATIPKPSPNAVKIIQPPPIAPQPKPVAIKPQIPPKPVLPPPIALPTEANEPAAETNVRNTAKYIKVLKDRATSKTGEDSTLTPTGATVSHKIEYA